MGVFKQIWDVYKENGCELTLHRSIATQLGDGAAFVTEMEAYLRDPDMFLLMLSVGLGGMFDTQSSFVGLLLREDELQARVIDFLLEKLSEFAAEMDGSVALAMEKNIPKLILREIRWIDHVVDSRELVEKLITAMPAFPVALQRDMIYILPEIASDEDAYAVIDAMLELIRSEAELVVSCIEALGNFNVVNEQTSDVVKCVLERLDSSPLCDLPVIVKYLVQEAPGADVDLIANELRDKLSATLSFVDTAREDAASEMSRRSSVGGNATGGDPTGNEEALVLGSIIQGFYFREDLMKAFLASISKSGEGGGSNAMRLLDMWVLMGAHSIPRDKIKLEKLLKKKVAAGVITRGLMVRSIKGHANALKSYFASLLQLSSMLITQQGSSLCMEMGSLMYEVLFEEFSLCQKDGKSGAAYYQGEIVTALLSFCLSASSETTNAAFRTFLALVSPQVSFQSEARDRRYEQSHFKRRFRFGLFLPALKQMLDAVELIALDQVRHVYDILFAIGGPEDSELYNTLRKQTLHQETRYRLCGIIGSVSRGNRLLLQYREDASTRAGAGAAAKAEAEAAKAFQNCIVDLFKVTTAQGGCVAFMLKEVKRWMKRLTLDDYSSTLVNIVSDFAMDVLTYNFMDDYDASRVPSGEYRRPVLGGSLKSDLWFSLDDQRTVLYLKVLDLAASPNVREQESLHYMSALVELVLECAHKTDQVRGVDTVLVCPIQLIEKSAIEDIGGLDEATQNVVCSAVWHSINWIRSIVGFYASQQHGYHKVRVVERLKNLVYLESVLLDQLLDSCRQFGPPGMQFADSARQVSTKTLGSTKKKAGRRPKITPTVDRVSLVRRSFDPIRADALKILGIPALWNCVVHASTLKSPDDIRPQELVHNLMMLFQDFVVSTSQLTKQYCISGVFSEAIGWSRSAGDEEADVNAVRTVLQSAGAFAHHFAQLLPREDEADGNDEADPDPDVDLQRIARRVVQAYLQVGAKLFDMPKITSDVETEKTARLCQDYFLPRDQHVQLLPGSDENVRSQVLESCFITAAKFSSTVGDDIQSATTFLRVLLAITGVSCGFPADQAIERAVQIQLKSVEDSSVAKSMSAKISSMALAYLQHDWSGGHKKYVYKSADLDVFIRSYLKHGVVLLDNVQTLSLDGILALMEEGGAELAAFPTLNKKTVPIFHRALFDALVSATARLDFRNASGRESTVLLLNYLTQAVLLFKLLVAVTKNFQKSKVVATVLKAGRKFVEVIVRAMPFLKDQFVDHNTLVMKVITEVQVATRRMQVLCAHGKLIKDATAVAQVPMVKRLLERFLYRGEELAREHGILDAFTTGVLKNKRIDGTTISKEELEAMEADGSDSENESEEETEEEGNGSTTENEAGDEDHSDGEQIRRPQKKRR